MVRVELDLGIHPFLYFDFPPALEAQRGVFYVVRARRRYDDGF